VVAQRHCSGVKRHLGRDVLGAVAAGIGKSAGDGRADARRHNCSARFVARAGIAWNAVACIWVGSVWRKKSIEQKPA